MTPVLRSDLLSGFGSIALLSLIGYLALGAYLYFQQSRLLFLPQLPTRAIGLTPAHYGMSYEPVRFTTSDGVALSGWWVPARESRAALLFAHGNAGNISHRLESIRLFHRLGLSVFIFDYRGYGESEGSPSETGTYRDGEAAWRYLTETRGIPARRILLFGRSLGGAIAAHVADVHPARALILESTFTSVPDFAAEQYPLFPVRLLARIRYDTRERLRRIRLPLLIVHSREDEIIPFRHGERLFADANEPKWLLPIRGGHNDGFLVSGDLYRDGIGQFLDRVLENPEG
ncbi:MAG: alpha/beta hydrolase [Gammaproteobacteria bacterium]